MLENFHENVLNQALINTTQVRVDQSLIKLNQG